MKQARMSPRQGDSHCCPLKEQAFSYGRGIAQARCNNYRVGLPTGTAAECECDRLARTEIYEPYFPSPAVRGRGGAIVVRMRLVPMEGSGYFQSNNQKAQRSAETIACRRG